MSWLKKCLPASARDRPRSWFTHKLKDVHAQTVSGRRPEIDRGFERPHDRTRETGRPALGRIRQTFERRWIEPQRQAYGKIANARFAVNGSSSIRMRHYVAPAFVKQRIRRAGQKVPWPPRWAAHLARRRARKQRPIRAACDLEGAEAKLNLSTFQLCKHRRYHRRKFRKPLVNREGELVGIIFDGNIQSLCSINIYTDQESPPWRTFGGILEALRKIYRGGPGWWVSSPEDSDGSTAVPPIP